MKHISLADSSEMERLSHIIYNLLLNTVTLTNCSGRRKRKKSFLSVLQQSAVLWRCPTPAWTVFTTFTLPSPPRQVWIGAMVTSSGLGSRRGLRQVPQHKPTPFILEVCISDVHQLQEEKRLKWYHYLLLFISHSAAANTQG